MVEILNTHNNILGFQLEGKVIEGLRYEEGLALIAFLTTNLADLRDLNGTVIPNTWADAIQSEDLDILIDILKEASNSKIFSFKENICKYQKIKLKNGVWGTSSLFKKTHNNYQTDNSFIKLVESVDRFYLNPKTPPSMTTTFSFVEVDFYFELYFGTTRKLLAVVRERKVLSNQLVDEDLDDFDYREKINVVTLSKPQSPRIVSTNGFLYPVGMFKTAIGSILCDPIVTVIDVSNYNYNNDDDNQDFFEELREARCIEEDKN